MIMIKNLTKDDYKTKELKIESDVVCYCSKIGLQDFCLGFTKLLKMKKIPIGIKKLKIKNQVKK